MHSKSADGDHLYAVSGSDEIYRSEHQASVLASKINLGRFSNVLDYGCAKAPTLRKLLAHAPDVKPHLFDVTDKYVPFWQDFPNGADWAAHRTKPDWAGRMDVVLSFYALEHIPHLADILTEVRDLLTDGGYFYFLVPNLYRNTADFIVADHVNHFSRNSLRVMLGRAGFTDIDIDETAHTAAFVVSARLDKSAPRLAPVVQPEMAGEVQEIAAFWGGIKERIQSFEATLGDTPRAIYGAGIYGNFILSCLKEPKMVSCFLDQHKDIIGTTIKDIPVRHPSDVPEDLAALLVGLNPKSARRIIAGVEALQKPSLVPFFLD